MSARWSWWWRVISSTRRCEVAEAVAMGGQDLVGVEAGHLLQRLEEVAERVAGAVAAGDRDVRA